MNNDEQEPTDLPLTILEILENLALASSLMTVTAVMVENEELAEQLMKLSGWLAGTARDINPRVGGKTTATPLKLV